MASCRSSRSSSITSKKWISWARVHVVCATKIQINYVQWQNNPRSRASCLDRFPFEKKGVITAAGRQCRLILSRLDVMKAGCFEDRKVRVIQRADKSARESRKSNRVATCFPIVGYYFPSCVEHTIRAIDSPITNPPISRSNQLYSFPRVRFHRHFGEYGKFIQFRWNATCVACSSGNSRPLSAIDLQNRPRRFIGHSRESRNSRES